MSTTAQSGSTPVAPAQSIAKPSQNSSDKFEERFSLGIWHLLSRWPALTLAIQSSWGGPNSSSKRDWLAAELASTIITRPETDTLDLEDMLLQVMQDEFDLQVEDESEVKVARDITELRKEVEEGRWERVDEMQRRWVEKGGKDEGMEENIVVQHGGEDDEGDSVDEESGSDEEMGDAEMSDAPAPARRERTPPQVDEDGFTTVPNRRKR